MRERELETMAASALATRLGRETGNEMDGLSTGNGFDHSFQRQGEGGCAVAMVEEGGKGMADPEI